MNYILEPFIIDNELHIMNNNLYKREELFDILNRIEKTYKLFNNNINEMNNKFIDTHIKINEQTIKIFKTINDDITNEEKEYNKIINELYKFNVD